MKFKSNIGVQAGIEDNNDLTGDSGQILSSTGTGVAWIDQNATSTTSDFVFFNVKNETGSTISKGKGVMAVGTDGNSGHILIDEMVADGTVEPKYFLGVLEEDIANGAFARVISFGQLSQFDTRGQNGETWADGQVLWCDPANNGDFTTTEPDGPNVKIAVAFILNSSTNGKIQVRVQANEGVHDLHDTKITSQIDGDVLVWDNTTGVWFNDSTLNVDYTNSRVGIGTTDPDGAFQVKTFGLVIDQLNDFVSESPVSRIFTTDGQPGGLRSSQGSHLVLQTRSNASRDIILATGTTPTERITVKGSGLVGINTSTPNTTLDVNGEGNFNNYLNVNGSFGIRSSGWVHLQRYNSNTNVSVGNNGSNVNLLVPNGNIETQQNIKSRGYLLFDNDGDFSGGNYYTMEDHSDGYFRMGYAFNSNLVIDTNGNVGIGTTSPGDKLTVSGGDIRGTESIFAEHDIRAPFMYDLDDTAFYVNPNNTSRINNLNVIGNATVTGTINASNFSGTSSGTNTGDQDLSVYLRNDENDTSSGIITAAAFRTSAANTTYSLITRNLNPGSYPLYVQNVNTAGDSLVARFAYGASAANSGTPVFVVGGTKSYFVNTSLGIGTDSPSEKLDVVGDVNVRGDLKSLGMVRATGWWNDNSTSSSGHGLEIGVSGGSSEGYILSYNRDTSSYGDINFAAVNFNFDERGGTTTIENNEIWHAGNDGSGSGLDADLLDGQHASAFAPASHNHNDIYYTETESEARYVKQGGTSFSGTYPVVVRVTDRNFYSHPNITYTGSNSSLFVGGDVRSPIFYDSNNTGYYLNPAGTSTLGFANFEGFDNTSANSRTTTGVSVGRYTSDYSYIELASTHGTNRSWIDFSDASGSDYVHRLRSHSDRFGIYSSSGEQFRVFSTYTDSVNSSRAPIFYDSNNTAYYLDPSTSATSINVRGEITNPSIWINDGDNVNNYNENIRLFNASNGVSVIAFGATGTGGVPTSSVLGFSDRHEIRIGTTWRTRTYGGNFQVNGDARATRFYDSNNTVFYVDPASTSQLNYVDAYRFRDKDDTSYYVEPASTSYLSSVHANIIYDRNDTAYYLNPASNSKYNTAQGNYLGLGTAANTSGSYRLNMGGSIHMNNNSINYVTQLHFNSNVRFYQDSNDSYLNFKYGDAATGGIKFLNGGGSLKGYVYADNSGFGLLDNDGAWALRTRTGTDPLEFRCDNNLEFSVYTSYTLSHGSSRAPIFYDSNDTTYYIDPNSTSRSARLRGEILIGPNTSSRYLRLGGNGGNTDYSTISTSNGNLHIDSTAGFATYLNHYAAGNVLVCNGGGYLHAYNSVRSPIFYDLDNTGYYVNPASQSHLNTLTLQGNRLGFVNSSFDAEIRVSDGNPNGTGAEFVFYGDGVYGNAQITAEIGNFTSGVFLGGTAAANKLDDYEEGSFTPSYSKTDNGPAFVIGNEGRYTKIGDTVHIEVMLNVNVGEDDTYNLLSITNLPFTVRDRSFSANATGLGFLRTGASKKPNFGHATDNGTAVYLFTDFSSGYVGFPSDETSQYTFTMTYKTTQ